MLLGALRWFNARAGIVVVLAYVGLFGLAFVLMFVFPLGSIFLIFVGLLGLGVTVPGIALSRAWERSLCRRTLRRGRCPACDAEVLPRGIEGCDGAGCLGCGREYSPDGSELEAGAART